MVLRGTRCGQAESRSFPRWRWRRFWLPCGGWSSCKAGRVIFPTPLQVVTATLDLAQQGTLWNHIGASLFRVGAGFLLAIVVAVPMGLWMGWVGGAFTTLNPHRPDASAHLSHRLDSACHSLVRRRRRLADFSDFPRVGISDDRADRRRSAHHRAAIPPGSGEFRRFAPEAVPPGRHPRRAPADHRGDAGQPRRGVARRRRGRDDRLAGPVSATSSSTRGTPEIGTTWSSPPWSSSE